MADPTRLARWKWLGDGEVGIWAPYAAKDRCKALPGAHWDPSMRCWRVPEQWQGEVTRLVETLNGGVDAHLVEAFIIILGVLDPDLARRVHRKLAGVLHPDAGGDLAAMTALNVAWEALP